MLNFQILFKYEQSRSNPPNVLLCMSNFESRPPQQREEKEDDDRCNDVDDDTRHQAYTEG